MRRQQRDYKTGKEGTRNNAENNKRDRGQLRGAEYKRRELEQQNEQRNKKKGQ